jgi:hypothetical protein
MRLWGGGGGITYLSSVSDSFHPNPKRCFQVTYFSSGPEWSIFLPVLAPYLATDSFVFTGFYSDTIKLQLK